jgi:hypothetical protein
MVVLLSLLMMALAGGAICWCAGNGTSRLGFRQDAQSAT